MTAAIGSSFIRVMVLRLSYRLLLDSECIVFSATKHREKECVALRGEVDGASEAIMALDVCDNTEKVEGVRALRHEYWCLLAHLHRVD